MESTLKANAEFDHILKADAHHIKVISTALLSNGRQGGKRDDRSHQPKRKATQYGALIQCDNGASLVRQLHAAVGSFMFVDIQWVYKNPAIADGVNVLSGDR